MSDIDLETAVHRALERQALAAPRPAGLLDTVKARSRRRRVRDGAVGGLAAVLAVVGAFVGMPDLHPGAGPPDVTAARGGPGVFAADELNLCLVYDGDRLAKVLFSGRVDGERVDSTVVAPQWRQVFRVHVEHAETYTLRMGVLPRSPAQIPLDDADSVTVAGRAGRLGDDPRGGRALYLETGVEDSTLRLRVDGTGPDDAQLLAWAQKIHISTDPAACGS